MSEAGTLLGFDYGTRHIGVAVGQALTGDARPLETLGTVNDKPDWSAIARLIETWRPSALVVGIPLNMDGSEQDMTHAARRFARQLEGRFGLAVHPVDERLSSIEAAEQLHARGDEDPAGGRRPRRRRGIDAVAAQVILQTWFSEAAAREHGAGSG